MNATEAKKQIEAVKHDKEKAAILRDKRHHRHAELLAEWSSLHQTAYPEQQ